MSTILKALKQIDQTTLPEDLQSWPPKIDTKKAVKTRVKKIWLTRKVFLASVLVLLAVTAGWVAYSQRELLLAKISSDRISENDSPASAPSSKNGPFYQAKIDPPASQNNIATAKESSPSGMKNGPAGVKAPPAQTRKDTPSGQLPKIPVRPKTDKNPIYTADRTPQSLPKAAASKSRIATSQMADRKKTVQNKPPAAAASEPKPASSAYRSLDESKLKLQAIAWSKDAAQRIAVINGHIVREGESVEGFSVTQIRQDDIIVNDGTESWRVEFRLK